MKFIEYVGNSTSEYLKEMSRLERKKIGQFFTPDSIAEHMGNLMLYAQAEVCILDAGAGSGILAAALLDKIRLEGLIKLVHLDLYENNEDILPLLNRNIEHIKQELLDIGILLDYRVIKGNFIIDNQFAWSGLTFDHKKYDVVIANPPYKKIGKNDPEAAVMRDIIYGQPNLYFLFMAMAAKLLKENGELVFIVPRSFSSGLYFTEFRKWFFREMKITNMHLFVSRDTIFSCDNILQETIIIKAIKTKNKVDKITITESESADSIMRTSTFKVPYSTCVKEDDNSFLFFPTSINDVETLDFINQWKYNLEDLGYRMKTGIVVDFREKQWLIAACKEPAIPLLWSYNIDENKILFPVCNENKPQYLVDSKDTLRLQMKVANYILIKRFTSKEERKRLQCALLFKDDFSKYQSISTENHLNFITKMNGDMTTEEMYGLFVIINSSYMDKYFRILNGSTQVNANEINTIPFPSYNNIIELGREAKKYEALEESVCDLILERKYDNILTPKAV